MDRIETLNRAFFLQINAPLDVPAGLVRVATVLADDLIYLIALLLMFLWLWGNRVRRSLAVEACLVALLGLGLNQLIGLVGLAWRRVGARATEGAQAVYRKLFARPIRAGWMRR